MGMKADQEISLDFEGLLSYLRSKTRVFMDVDGHEYYVTHTDGYWRVQDCEQLNEKGRFVDCSELVTTLPELVELPWLDGKSVHDLTDGAAFFESIQVRRLSPPRMPSCSGRIGIDLRCTCQAVGAAGRGACV